MASAVELSAVESAVESAVASAVELSAVESAAGFVSQPIRTADPRSPTKSTWQIGADDCCDRSCICVIQVSE